MRHLLNDLPHELDLTDAGHLAGVLSLAEAMLAESRNPAVLAQLEAEWAAEREQIPLMAHVAVKLARSRRMVEELTGSAHLSVVFAVYNEHTRILTRAEHPHGEDFLREKIRQLRWLFADRSDCSWDLTVVDDGCDQGSGQMARRILAEDPAAEARVLFLKEAIAQGLPVTQPLHNASESRKGGSVLLGMWQAAQSRRPGHVVLFTDADLSTHLGQAGLLMHPLLNDDADCAIGSRREPTSISIKQGTRNVRGKLFIYLWKRLFPPLHEIVDTQCGFKAFTAETVRAICESTIEKKFAFDIELLLKTQLRRPGRITKVPIAWIDSDAASTTTDLQPYLPMLQTMVQLQREYLEPDDEVRNFARLLRDLDQESWDRLVDDVPAEIAEREPHTFGDWSGVTVGELRDRAGL